MKKRKRIKIDHISPGPARFYVYTLTDSLTGQVFYVGKGTRQRARQHEVLAQSKSQWCTPVVWRIREIWQDGGTVIKQTVHWTDDELAAYREERSLIATLGLVTLENVQPGCFPRRDLTPRPFRPPPIPVSKLPRIELGHYGAGEVTEKLTEFQRESDPIDVVDGTLTYLDWCHREAARIGAIPGRCAKVVKRGRDVAVFANVAKAY